MVQACSSMPVWVNSDYSPEAEGSDDLNKLYGRVYMEKLFSC